MLVIIIIALYKSVENGGSFMNKYPIERVTIHEKYTKRVGNLDKHYVSTDKGVFEIGNSVIHGQFNSSDVYGLISPGRCYSFQVYGFRSDLASSYPTILEVKQMGC